MRQLLLNMRQLLHHVINKYLNLSKIIFTLLWILLLANERMNAQNELDVIRNNWLQYSDAPNSLYHHLAGQAFNLLKERTDAVSGLNTLSGWQQRQNWVKKTLLDIVGPYSLYSSIVLNRFYKPSFILNTVPGALKAYDLPDLASNLAPRKLLMAGVTDGNGKSLDPEAVNKDLDIIQTTYRSRNADGQLSIVSLKPNEKLYDYLMDWIKN